MWIPLFSVVTLFEYNVSTILSPIFAYITSTPRSILTTPENIITYHNALCLSPQNFA